MNGSSGHSRAEAGRRGPESTRIAIVGGGAAGIEATLALRHFGGDRAEVVICSTRDRFEMRPLAVWKAMKGEDILSFDLELLTHAAGARLIKQSVESVDVGKRKVELSGGEDVFYDYLLIATGTKSLWVVPGAQTFWGPESGDAVAAFKELRNAIGPSRIVLTMPDLSAWPLPIYELALYLAAEAGDSAMSSVRITIATPETGPLEVFGEAASKQAVGLLADRGIEFLPSIEPMEFENGSLASKSGERIKADRVITLPSLTGRRLKGISYNDRGFIEVDSDGQVKGLDQVFAAGDVTDFPVKFGSLATGQADVAAASIAVEAWSVPRPESLRPRLSATLLTPDGPVSLDQDEDRGEGPRDGEAWDSSQKIHGRFLSPFLASMRD